MPESTSTGKLDSDKGRTPSETARRRDGSDFELSSFFPYLVRIYYRAVSQSVSSIYSTLYGLSVSEWRTMAVLGPHQPLSASEIVERSSMDKVNVSRAIAGLRKKGFLGRGVNADDRRRVVLWLTENGNDVFQTLVPLIRELEAKLLDGLSEDEQATLIRLMEKVRNNAAAVAPVRPFEEDDEDQ
jgi:DNA-binding MarR family transcriptional regulator